MEAAQRTRGLIGSVQQMVDALNAHDPKVTYRVVTDTCEAAATAHPNIAREIIAIRDECRAILRDRARLAAAAAESRLPQTVSPAGA